MGSSQHVIAQMQEHARLRAEERNAGIDPDECPRADKPLTWVAVSPDRMVICRKIIHTDQVLRQHAVVTFHRDEYVDCMHCRKDRWNRRNDHRTLEELRRQSSYWCNACQGTGWDVEPWEAVRARLGLTTWKERIAALKSDVLIKAVAGENPEGFPRDLLLEEAATRFAAGTDVQQRVRLGETVG